MGFIYRVAGGGELVVVVVEFSWVRLLWGEGCTESRLIQRIF